MSGRNRNFLPLSFLCCLKFRSYTLQAERREICSLRSVTAVSVIRHCPIHKHSLISRRFASSVHRPLISVIQSYLFSIFFIFIQSFSVQYCVSVYSITKSRLYNLLILFHLFKRKIQSIALNFVAM